MSAVGMVIQVMIKLLSRRLLAALLAGAMAAATASTGWAHTNLVRSDPGDGAILTEAPADLRMWFDENVSSFFSSTKILASDGHPVAAAVIRIDRNEPNRMVVSLPELPHGVYSTLWRVLSEGDGHVSRGAVVFGVGPGTDLATAVRSESEFTPPAPEIILRWLNFAGLAALIGAVAVAALALPANGSLLAVNQAVGQALHDGRRRMLGWGCCCAVFAVATGTGLLIWQTTVLGAALPETVSLLSTAWLIVTETRWGALWLARGAALIALGWVLFSLARHVPRESRIELSQGALWLAAVSLAIALAVLQALTGHAAMFTTNTDLALVADATHLLAAGMWAGGMTALTIGLVPLIRCGASNLPLLVRAGWRTFSPIAALSVALLVITGLYNLGRQVASVDALVTTLYGQALLAKVAMTLAMGALGLANAMLLRPALLARLLRRPPGWIPSGLQRLPMLVRFEMGFALLIFLAVGVITATPPPKGAEFTVADESIVSERSLKVDDVVVTLSVKPNRAGHNAFSLFANSMVRPPPTKIERVLLRFRSDGTDGNRAATTAHEVAPGRFVAAGSFLGRSGPSQIDVIIRRRGMEDSVARFDWMVAPPGGPRPVLVSKERLEPLLNLVAWGGALLIVMLMGLAWLARTTRRQKSVGLKVMNWRRLER